MNVLWPPAEPDGEAGAGTASDEPHPMPAGGDNTDDNASTAEGRRRRMDKHTAAEVAAVKARIARAVRQSEPLRPGNKARRHPLRATT